ncbi:MAG: NAD(P)/FAD-dependent oxidoreductase [Candidatus Omnitrophota bacterium]
MQNRKIAVIGAGPAGLMAAIRAGQLNQEVTLFERNTQPGKKLLLSGKGRCNITNALSLEDFLKHFSNNGNFLRDAFKKFFNTSLITFFEERGLKMKVERQMRVFPVTDSSGSILAILKKELSKRKVKVIYKAVVKDIIIEDKAVKGVIFGASKREFFDSVIMATGGASYPFTGSDGSGINILKNKGHRIIPLKPGLVGLKVKEDYLKSLEGLTLKNIRLKFSCDKKEVISDIGEMLFTKDGISGPLVLSLSARLVDWLSEGKKVYLAINLKPGLTLEKIDIRLLREFKSAPKKNIANIMKNLLPAKLAELLAVASGVTPIKKANQITSAERNALVSFLHSWHLTIIGSGNIEEGMVTRGGVSLKEINPRTMESKLINGLYLCGEMIDIDADTGGFNLQAAFSTGYLAGESAAVN